MKKFEQTFFGRPSTIRAQESLFLSRIKPGIRTPRFFGQEDMQRLVREWAEEGLKPNTISTLLGLACRYVRWARGPVINPRPIRNYISSLPGFDDQPKVLTRAQASLLLNHSRAKYPQIFPILLLGFHGGLRFQEVFALEKQDLDFTSRQIRICRGMTGPTKSGKTRIIPMSPELEQTLREVSDHCKEPRERLFRFNKRLNEKLKKMCGEIGLPPITFHATRHTFCTTLLDSGVNPKIVQTLAGHSKASTTLSMYWQNVNQNLDVSEHLPRIP